MLFGPFSRPGDHVIVRPYAWLRRSRHRLFEPRTVLRYVLFRPMPGGHGPDEFFDCFPSDCRRGVARVYVHPDRTSSESHISQARSNRRTSVVNGLSLISIERTTVSSLRAQAMSISLWGLSLAFMRLYISATTESGQLFTCTHAACFSRRLITSSPRWVVEQWCDVSADSFCLGTTPKLAVNWLVEENLSMSMMRDSPASEWRPKKLTSKQEEVFMELGILERPKVIKRKVGRPKGSKNKPKVQ